MPMDVDNCIIIYDLFGQCYYIHMYMILVEGSSNCYHNIPFILQKPHCQPKLYYFLLLTCMMFSNILAFTLKVLRWLSVTVRSGIWLWHLIITISTNIWMHNDQFVLGRPVLLVLTIQLSYVGSIPHSFNLIQIYPTVLHIYCYTKFLEDIVGYNSLGIPGT